MLGTVGQLDFISQARWDNFREVLKHHWVLDVCQICSGHGHLMASCPTAKRLKGLSEANGVAWTWDRLQDILVEE